MKEIEVVGAVIHRHDHQYLCALRGENISQAGFWEFPGGKVEPGEDHREALRREIEEELGCIIKVNNHVVTATHDYDSVRVHLHTYLATVEQGTPVAKEHQELRWVSLVDLKSLKWAPADIPTIDKLLE